MPEPIENLYFNWLYAKVCDPRAHSPSLNYQQLLTILHKIEFLWLVVGDDNRAEDGLDLRTEFADIYGEADDLSTDGCSFLEMLIALSRRAGFQTEVSEHDWFWRMLENLYLAEMHDGNRVLQNVVVDIVSVCIWRNYDFCGNGGLFPLLRSKNDQRKVEIWYQFSEYIYQNDVG